MGNSSNFNDNLCTLFDEEAPQKSGPTPAERLLMYFSSFNKDFSELEKFIDSSKGSPILDLAIFNIFKLSESSSYKKVCPYLLPEGVSESLILSSKQCSELLADMFLCQIKRSPSSKLNRDGDFTRLFEKDQRNSKNQKLAMIFEYFAGVESLQNTLVFNRHAQSLSERVSCQTLSKSKLPLSQVSVKENGKIEDSKDSAWVDFANKYIGGGVLGSGFLQEEKLFMSYPELLTSLLFVERLGDNEVFSINILNSKDSVEIIGMDAIDFSRNPNKQYSFPCIERELNKAYLGFSKANSQKISTGKWGCGAFGGDPQLKFIIQWLACSMAGKEMIFYSGNDIRLSNLKIFYEKFKNKKIGDLVEEVERKLVQNSRYMDFFTSALYSKI